MPAVRTADDNDALGLHDSLNRFGQLCLDITTRLQKRRLLWNFRRRFEGNENCHVRNGPRGALLDDSGRGERNPLVMVAGQMS